ncbi:hypothetical protein GOD21_30005 [Sinorhizobium medicae]|nr:hypothetical protein [Sinorhizobium medicae]
MEQMRQQAENVGTKLMYDIITSVDLWKRPFRLQAHSGDTYLADALIIATGAQPRWLGLPSEKLFAGFGVSACATFDGFFCRGSALSVEPCLQGHSRPSPKSFSSGADLA